MGVHACLIILMQPTLYIKAPYFIGHVRICICRTEYGQVQSCWRQSSFHPPASPMPATFTSLTGCRIIIWICSSRTFWGGRWEPPPPPPPPGAGLALICHLCGIAAFSLGASDSVTPSWASGTGSAPPTSYDDPILVDLFACTGKTGSSIGQTHCLRFSSVTVACCCPASSGKRTISKCADFPIHATKASGMWEHMARASSLERPWYPCLS